MTRRRSKSCRRLTAKITLKWSVRCVSQGALNATDAVSGITADMQEGQHGEQYGLNEEDEKSAH